MSKTIQDYRNIVKILKLQLLKVRQENISISNQLGIMSETETSSFTPKINHYKACKPLFAHKVLLFLDFAHRCEIIGVSPEMIFRIADKKRDKKVGVSGITEIMKRLKLRMTEEQIAKLMNVITKTNSIFYQEYLEYLSAFQINSEKFPAHSQRTYIQQCLIRFGKQCQGKYSSPLQLFKKINGNEDKPHFQFQEFVSFSRKQASGLKQIQMVAVFLGLDIQSECQIEKGIFKRQMEKVYSLIQRGVADEPAPIRSNQKAVSRMVQQPEEDEFKEDTQTGIQKGNVTKKKAVVQKPVKIDKGNTKFIQGQLKKQSLSVTRFIEKLLQREDKELMARSFSLGQIWAALKALKETFPKKEMLKIFKQLDKDGNGSASTQELIKLWIRSDDNKFGNNPQNLFKLLNRHLREIQFPSPLPRFTNLGFKGSDVVKASHIQQVFQNLELSEQETDFILASVSTGSTVAEFAQILKSEGKKKPSKEFKPMEKKDKQRLSQVLSKLCKNPEKAKFKKLKRLEDGEQPEGVKTWQSIFTDQWACYDFCLKTASKLQTFWRDPEFGPTSSDPHGYRSIVGNESDIPPGLPDEEDIQWSTFQQILLKNNDRKTPVRLMSDNLQSTDVIQGKLGNCWYVSALSIIASDDTYIKGKPLSMCEKDPNLLTYGIHPTLFHVFAEYGMYVFKYFKKFKPVYVVVDDLFPIQSSTNDLIFAKSPDAGLQWVAFAEKSYAKLHHSYSNMISGDIAQGLNDLTNALPIKENLSADNPDNIDKMRRLSQQKQLMGCSISAPKGTGVEQPVQLDDERCGLFYGHAYSIIDYLDLPTKDQVFNLIRIRNPWGNGQWVLDWSDRPVDDYPEYQKLKQYKDDLSRYYDKRIKKAKQLKEQPPVPYESKEDGEFLMNFKDWTATFSNLFTGLSVSYEGQYIIDKWDSATPSGLCKSKGASQKQRAQFVKNNHQYVLNIEQQTDVLMLAIQEDGRLYRGEKYPYKQLVNAVIVLVFNLESNEQSLSMFDKEKMTDPSNLRLEVRRDVDFWHKFKPGRYAVMPCKNKNQIPQTEFEFRVYSEKPVKIKKVSRGSNTFKPIGEPPRNNDKDFRSSVSCVMDFLKAKNPKY